MRNIIRYYSATFLIILAVCLVYLCGAMALTIPNAPLFVSTVQQPNVMITLDASSTMLGTVWRSDYAPSYSTSGAFDPNHDWNVLVPVYPTGSGSYTSGGATLIYHDSSGVLKIAYTTTVDVGDTVTITIGTQAVKFPNPATQGKALAQLNGSYGTGNRNGGKGLLNYLTVAGNTNYKCFVYNGNYLNWAFNNGTVTPTDISGAALAETWLGSLAGSGVNSINNFVKNNASFSFGLMVGPYGSNSMQVIKSCGSLTSANVDQVLGKSGGTYPSNDYLLDPANANSIYQKNIVSVPVDTAGGNGTDPAGSNIAPLDEMLAENWRYFSGLTSGYNSGVTYTSPITASCQSNFVVLFSSGRIHKDTTYTDLSGALIMPGVNNITSSTTGFQATTQPSTPSSGGISYAATDFQTRAMYVPQYLSGNAPMPSVSTKTILVYTVGVGYNLPDPSTSYNTGVLQRIAHYGLGSYMPANSSSDLGQALNAVTSAVVNAISSASSVAVNTAFLQTNTQLFTAQFLPGVWTGDVMAFSINVSNGDLVGYPNNPAWSAARGVSPGYTGGLNSRSATSRKIFTSYSSASAKFTQIDFNASSASALQPLLGASSFTDAQTIISTILGVNNANTSGYRVYPVSGSNVQKFGDVVSSSPVYVGAPPYYYTDLDYRSFQVANQNRKGVVYIGANDGILHAFFAGSAYDTVMGNPGDEVWGYIPNHLMKGLNPANKLAGALDSLAGRVRDLARPDPLPAASPVYGTSAFPHKFMVNGTPTVGDAVVGFHNYSSPTWGTALLGTEREGGKGVFALNVTDPSPPSGSVGPQVMWEFSDWDDPDMGYSFSNVMIVKTRYQQTLSSGFLTHETWAAVFGNGYNSANGQAYLMVVDMKTGKLIKKILGNAANNTANTTGNNGLATPALVADTSGYVTYAYAGDLLGNVYKFDLRNTNPASWASTLIFTATDGASPANTQPITSAPDIGWDGAKYIILFGTGKYLEKDGAVDDRTTTLVQSFYGVFDPPAGTTYSRTNLAQRTFNNATLSGGQPIRYVTGNAIGTSKGWFVDLQAKNGATLETATGERVVTDSVLYSNNIIFSSFVASSAPCSYGGYSWLNVLDFRTGLQPGKPDLYITNGATPDTYTDPTTGTTYSPSGMKFTGAGMASSPTVLSASGGIAYKYTTLSSGTVVKTTEAGSATSGNNFIKAWRELIPYQGI